MSSGGDHGFESWRTLHKRWDPYTAGRARSVLREILSPSRVKLSELMGAIERMEDLVRRCCGRRDAQGNVHSLAEDIRMISLEALLPYGLEKHVQLNRARLTSYGVLREEIKTYCGSHAARNAKQKGSSHPGGDDPMDIGAFGKGKGKQGKKQGQQGQQGQQGRERSKEKDKNKDSDDHGLSLVLTHHCLSAGFGARLADHTGAGQALFGVLFAQMAEEVRSRWQMPSLLVESTRAFEYNLPDTFGPVIRGTC